MKAKVRKNFHITIVDNRDKTVEVDEDVNFIAGIIQSEDNIVTRLTFSDASRDRLHQLIVGLVREAAYLSEKL